MNAGTGPGATLANGTRMRKTTEEAAIIAQAHRRWRRPAGKFDRKSVRSSAATSDTATSTMGFRQSLGIAPYGNNRVVARLRETKRSLLTSLMTADMAPIQIDKNFTGRSGMPRNANPSDEFYVPSLFSNVVTCGAGTISPK